MTFKCNVYPPGWKSKMGGGGKTLRKNQRNLNNLWNSKNNNISILVN